MEVKSFQTELKASEALSTVHKVQEFDRQIKTMPEKGKEKIDVKKNKINLKDLDRTVDNVNDYINMINRKIQFKIMRNYDNQMVIQVIDKDKEELIKQIPPEYLLKLEKSLAEITGILTDEIA